MTLAAALLAVPAGAQTSDPFAELGIPASAPGSAPGAAAARAVKAPPSALDPLEASLPARLAPDLEDMLAWRGELEAVLAYAASRPQVFPPAPVSRTELFDEYRDEARAAWTRALDLLLCLDAAAARYAAASRLSTREARAAAFGALAVSFAARARFVRSWSAYAERDAALKALFDEPVRGLGVPAGALSRLAGRYAGDPGRKAASLVRSAWDASGGPKALLGGGAPGRRAAVATAAELKALAPRGARRSSLAAAAAAASSALAPRQSALRAEAGPEVAARNVLPLLPPVPEGELTVSSRVAYAVGTARQWFRLDASTAAAPPDRDEVEVLQRQLQPGDVLLARRPWALGAAGQEGWWCAAGLYAGGDAERRASFGDDSLSAALRAAAPALTETSSAAARGDVPSVIAAAPGGVRAVSLDVFASAAAVAALRPRVPAAAKAEALRRAAALVGRPYDPSQAAAVPAAVAEGSLLARAYEGALTLEGASAAGPRAPSPNALTRRFDETFGTPAQSFDFVAGIAPGGEADERRMPLEAFRASWRGPKWDLAEEAPAEEKAR